MRKALVYLIVIGLVLGVSGRAVAGIIVAEELLVDLRAEDLSYGTVTQTWVNTERWTISSPRAFLWSKCGRAQGGDL